MVNKPLIRPYFRGGSFGGGVARIPMMPVPWIMDPMGYTIYFQFMDRIGVSCRGGFLQCLTSCNTGMDDTQTQAGWGTLLSGSAAPTLGYPPSY